MLMVKVGYPTREEERKIMDRMTQPDGGEGRAGRHADRASRAPQDRQAGLRRRQGEGLHRRSRLRDARTGAKHGLKDLAPLIEFGASPRASIALNLAARAHAFLRHRGYVTPEDVKAVGPDVLRHRLVLTYEADAEEVTTEQIVKRVFEVVEVP
jgi:MoxR-like ATPase